MNHIFEQSPKRIIPIAKHMMKESMRCVRKFPSLMSHPNACEVGFLPTHEQDFTVHTHTIPEVDYPSQKDIETTIKRGKKMLCIANSGSGKLICWKGKNFDRKSFERKLI